MYDRGSIVVVNMRWTDGRGSKPRPAAILSTASYHKDRKDVVIVALTSQIERLRLGDYEPADWQDAGLLAPTKSKAVLATVDRSALRKSLGSLSTSDLSGLEESIRLSIGL